MRVKLKHITYDIEIVVENEVWFTILDQDTRFFPSKNKDGEFREAEFQAKNGIYIYSQNHPEIGRGYMYLRGCTISENNTTAIKAFAGPNQCLEYCKKVSDALKDWDENWGGWADEKPHEKNFFS